MSCAFAAAALAALTLALAPPPSVPEVVPAPAAVRDPGWRAPVAGAVEVLRPFRPPPGPYAAGHRGVDLAARPGDPVLAAGRGRVGFAGPVAGRGVVVVVHPGGLRTSYEPVAPALRAGAWVEPGAVLGVLTTSAHCPRACLHWGLRDAAGYRDPMTLLAGPRAPVRLLPVDGAPGLSAAPRPIWCAGRASPSNGSGRRGSPRRRRAPRPRRE